MALYHCEKMSKSLEMYWSLKSLSPTLDSMPCARFLNLCHCWATVISKEKWRSVAGWQQVGNSESSRSHGEQELPESTIGLIVSSADENRSANYHRYDFAIHCRGRLLIWRTEN